MVHLTEIRELGWINLRAKPRASRFGGASRLRGKEGKRRKGGGKGGGKERGKERRKGRKREKKKEEEKE